MSSSFLAGWDAVAINRVVTGQITEKDELRQFHRLTLVAREVSQTAALNAANPILSTYDIVAVQPLNERMFEQACTSLEVDIITVDLSKRLPFCLRTALVKSAIQRGVVCELAWSGLVREASTTKRVIIGTAQDLVRSFGRKNVIVASGVLRTAELRTPDDVMNIATLFGLKYDAARDAISIKCRSLLLRGESRRTHKATLRLAAPRCSSEEGAVSTSSMDKAIADDIVVREAKRKRGRRDEDATKEGGNTKKKRKKRNKGQAGLLLRGGV
eukprot:jgi/Chlat1/6792/Chrsp51S06489